MYVNLNERSIIINDVKIWIKDLKRDQRINKITDIKNCSFPTTGYIRSREVKL